MRALMHATLWRDAGFGNTYKGLYFQGHTSFSDDPDDTNRAAVGWHQLHNTGALNTGKATLENCAFANFDVAMLFGAGLARFGEMASSFPGEAATHADHPALRKVWVQGCDYAYVVRTDQSVGHNIKDLRIVNCNTGIYLERGGQFSAEDVTVSGFVSGTGPTLLRLGLLTGNNCLVRVSDSTSTRRISPPGDVCQKIRRENEHETAKINCDLVYCSVFAIGVIRRGVHDQVGQHGCDCVRDAATI
jgi:hypothetical protein